MSKLILHPQLEKDCIIIRRMELCVLLLMNDSNYPWFILVPQREGITEIHQLSQADQQQLMRESSHLAAVIETAFKADKINIAALGNMVPQLHIHHIVRYKTDPAWPAPVWGKLPPGPYESGKAEDIVALLKSQLSAAAIVE